MEPPVPQRVWLLPPRSVPALWWLPPPSRVLSCDCRTREWAPGAPSSGHWVHAEKYCTPSAFNSHTFDAVLPVVAFVHHFVPLRQCLDGKSKRDRRSVGLDARPRFRGRDQCPRDLRIKRKRRWNKSTRHEAWTTARCNGCAQWVNFCAFAGNDPSCVCPTGALRSLVVTRPGSNMGAQPGRRQPPCVGLPTNSGSAAPTLARLAADGSNRPNTGARRRPGARNRLGGGRRPSLPVQRQGGRSQSCAPRGDAYGTGRLGGATPGNYSYVQYHRPYVSDRTNHDCARHHPSRDRILHRHLDSFHAWRNPRGDRRCALDPRRSRTAGRRSKSLVLAHLATRRR